MRARGFTLVELLVVIAIMALMGTLAVGGYRAMQRGMEERGVVQNVNQFIRTAYQRAQIDRVPTAVFFWNETLREETESEPLAVVGRAVAVRRAGRLSGRDGNYLYDEFGDLADKRLKVDEDEEDEGSSDSSQSGSTAGGSGIYLYYMNDVAGGGIRRSVVAQTTKKLNLGCILSMSGASVQIPCYAYVLDVQGSDFTDWEAGDAYGFEFAEIQLPHNYLFGSSYSKTASNPVEGEQTMRFRVSGNAGSGSRQGAVGSDTIAIYSLRPDSSGNLTAEKVATTDSPTKSLN